MTVTKSLLIHWWHYYGKQIYTLEELNQFEKIIDKYGVDKVLEVALASYICGDGSPNIILNCIRKNKVEKMIETLPDIEKLTDKQKECHNEMKERFLKIISSTCN